MSYWLKWHILITDKKLGEFLNAQVSWIQILQIFKPPQKRGFKFLWL
jgi:hypothetical protein